MAKKLQAGMKIERVRLDTLRQADRNPNKHPERNLEAIKASLQRFGQREPLIIRRESMEPIGGNGRLRAMVELGWEDADVIFMDGMSDDEAVALGIALNRTGELSQWDMGELLAELNHLSEAGFGDLSAIGWNSDELTKISESLLVPDESHEEPEPPSEFREYDETIQTHYQCPKCGYEWSGGARQTRSDCGEFEE